MAIEGQRCDNLASPLKEAQFYSCSRLYTSKMRYRFPWSPLLPVLLMQFQSGNFGDDECKCVAEMWLLAIFVMGNIAMTPEVD